MKLIIVSQGGSVAVGSVFSLDLRLDFCFGDVLVLVFIGIEPGRVVDDAAHSLGGGESRIPFRRPEEGNDTRKEIEKLIRMLLLKLGKLLSSSVPNEVCASSLKESG